MYPAENERMSSEKAPFQKKKDRLPVPSIFRGYVLFVFVGIDVYVYIYIPGTLNLHV